MRSRLLPLLLELLMPGTGYFVLGRPVHALGCFVATAAAFVGVTGSVLSGSLFGFWTASLVLVVFRIVGTLGCVRIPERRRPSPRVLTILVVLAFLAPVALLGTLGRHVWGIYRVPSDAMYPSLAPGDYVMIAKVARPILRGEVVAFSAPNYPELLLTKRVLAVPGDTIRFQDNQAYVNGQVLPHVSDVTPCRASPDCRIVEETAGGFRYAIALDSTSGSQFPEALVPPEHVFVVNDNRNNNIDSRAIGPVPIENVVGHFQFTVLSSGKD